MHEEEPTDDNATLQEILAQRRSRSIRNVVLGILLLALLGLAAWWFTREEPAPPPPPRPARVAPKPPPPPPPAPKPAPTPVATPAPPPPLPTLDESDPLVRESVQKLSSASALAAWLVPDELVRRFVAATDSVAEGRSPREQLVSLWPSEQFSVRQDEESVLVDPASWERYDTLTEVFVGLDPRRTVALYHELQPLFEQAYDDLGYPDRSFDEALRGAIEELLAAPVLVGDVEVAPRVISWEYTDPDLESLSGAQKALLRTGPMNAPRIQSQLRAMAVALGIPERSLPRTRVYSSRETAD